jgi:hypothetical protein
VTPQATTPAAPPPTGGEEGPRCAGCGYDLRGLTEDRCPECGLRFVPTARPVADVPWLHRAAIGNWTAYWRTVWLVAAHPSTLGREVWRDVQVDADQARVFRRVTTLIVAASAVAMGLSDLVGPTARRVSPQGIVAGALLIGFLLGLLVDLAMRLKEPEPHPRPRFEALRMFLCAPFALSPAVALCAWAAVPLGPGATRIAFLAAAAAVWLVWWCSAVRFARHALRPTLRRLLSHALLILPGIWITAGLLTIVVAGAVMFVLGGVLAGLL